MKDFCLLETMRVSGHSVYLFERHLERLVASARYFGFACEPLRLRETILHAVAPFEGPTRVRLLLRRGGTFDLEFYPLGSDETPRRLEVSTIRVSSDDPFLYHKTTNRRVYERARAGCDSQTDVILVNERGEITESTIANIAMRRQGQWITPHVSCGLLPGIMRAELLAEAKIAEGTIHVPELVRGEIVRCFNSVRGVFDVGLG